MSAFLALLFVMVLPRLYYAYTSINHVRPELNGFHSGSRQRRDAA